MVKNGKMQNSDRYKCNKYNKHGQWPSCAKSKIYIKKKQERRELVKKNPQTIDTQQLKRKTKKYQEKLQNLAHLIEESESLNYCHNTITDVILSVSE